MMWESSDLNFIIALRCCPLLALTLIESCPAAAGVCGPAPNATLEVRGLNSNSKSAPQLLATMGRSHIRPKVLSLFPQHGNAFNKDAVAAMLGDERCKVCTNLTYLCRVYMEVHHTCMPAVIYIYIAIYIHMWACARVCV